MMTIVSRVQVEEGREPAWDEAFRKRAAAARDQPGFVSLQLGIPVDELSQRVVIGTWQTRADWEAWHATEPFQNTRAELDEPEAKTLYEGWYEIIVEERT
jgi:heme-degrading monooxygenase HmoA